MLNPRCIAMPVAKPETMPRFLIMAPMNLVGNFGSFKIVSRKKRLHAHPKIANNAKRLNIEDWIQRAIWSIFPNGCSSVGLSVNVLYHWRAPTHLGGRVESNRLLQRNRRRPKPIKTEASGKRLKLMLTTVKQWRLTKTPNLTGKQQQNVWERT